MPAWRYGGTATLALLIIRCATGGITPSGRSASLLGPDNRVLLSDFSEVEAVAASPWLVFAATSHGLLIFDRVANRFRPPVTALDGYPAGRVVRALADQTGTAVWLDLGAAGGYIRYDADARIWTPGSLPSNQNRALTVESALAQAPLADAMRAAILTDARLRVHQFTAAAMTPDRPEIFFGTDGLGLVRVDKQTGEWQVLSYGLLSPSVGAVAPAPDSGGVWTAANARYTGAGARRGVTWVAGDLARTQATEFSFLYSYRMLATGGHLWIATDQGVIQFDQQSRASRSWDLQEPTCLAQTDAGIWVGTTHGLSVIGNDGRVSDIESNGVAIVSLLAVHDTVWVGTTIGLGRVLPGADAISTPAELADRTTLHQTIYALAHVQDTILLATERQLLWRNPTTREWTGITLPLSLGRPTAMAADPKGGLWIGGTLGLAQADLTSGLIQVHPVPVEIPAAVRDLTIDRDYVWAATDSGLLRIQ